MSGAAQSSAIPPLRFIYRNHRGEVAVREAIPVLAHFGSTDWHPEPQWLLTAFDIDRKAERDFAMLDMSPIPPISTATPVEVGRHCPSCGLFKGLILGSALWIGMWWLL